MTATEPNSGLHQATHRAVAGARSTVAIVVIGRNEGERLQRCFASLGPMLHSTVYVDSGSSDGSVAWARSQNVSVVELDSAVNFTAARARNAGFQRAMQLFPDAEVVQFVDGDCQIAPGWLDRAESALGDEANCVAVFGRLHELAPETSIYNRICEVEWNLAPVGITDTCGGNVAISVAAFRAAGGFDAAMPAGEEGELCVRLRRAGGIIRRLDADMGWHDAAITRWTQWWARAVRFGLAAAEGAARHGGTPERFHVKDVAKAVLTGGVLPIAIIALAWPTHGWSLLGLLYYPWVAWRVARHARGRNVPWRSAMAFGVSVALAKIPQCIGVIRWTVRRLFRRPPRLIEYK